ncbi:MAG: pancreas/duodenum homeobox protein 1 [Desulfovibrionaceae bacterium]|nr:pancreas/duodenum homeobox protein 1 [Desulfovibrionaceae bacterium]
MNTHEKAVQLFTRETLDELFPPERSDDFFDALYGDAAEGAYDIRLVFRAADPKILHFAFELRRRPGKCLACNVTYGLPQVFTRHPIINLKGLAEALGGLIGWDAKEIRFTLGRTEEHSPELHLIHLSIQR